MFMLKIVLFFGVFGSGCIIPNANGQGKGLLAVEQKSYVVVKGIVRGELSKQPIHNATVFYQKLPYYDDTGYLVVDSTTGRYEITLLRGKDYILKFDAPEFDPVEVELKAETAEGNAFVERDIILPLDEAHKILRLNSLKFSRGKSNISSSSFEELDALANWLKRHPKSIIRLEGHTDFAGNAKANLQLSEDRVDAIQQYLCTNGAKRKQVKTKAFGGEQPLTKDRSDSAKALNRRVEVRFVKY